MSTLTFAFRGPLAAIDDAARQTLFARATTSDPALRATVALMLDEVRRDGDRALRAYAARFDGVTLEALEVPMTACRAALAALDPALRRVMERAAANIREVHAAFRPVAQEVVTADGVVIGRRPDPLARVGVYAPGGRAAYPSSVLMGAVPARVAGVDEVILCSPPGPDGRPSAVVLAAAALAGVDRVFAVGGAGAVAAMAFGTGTVPAVDRIVGPGNAYVAEAKAQVASVVGIDSPAGPSELLVLADATATPRVIAQEMLAQAEHDPVAAVVLVTDSAALEREVCAELEARIGAQPRRATIHAAFASRGALVRAPSLEAAVDFANAWAPEHLLLAVTSAAVPHTLDRLRNAGTVFVGESASVAFGDYLSGANHVLPTGGAARAYSGLSTLDFVRWTTYQRIAPAIAAKLADDVGTFAEAEGLPAHAAAARHWSRA